MKRSEFFSKLAEVVSGLSWLDTEIDLSSVVQARLRINGLTYDQRMIRIVEEMLKYPEALSVYTRIKVRSLEEEAWEEYCSRQVTLRPEMDGS